MTEKEKWVWWASADDEDYTVGPRESREKVIEAAKGMLLGDYGDGAQIFFVMEVLEMKNPKISNYINFEELLVSTIERLEEDLGDPVSDIELVPISLKQKNDLIHRIRKTVDEWQEESDVRPSRIIFANYRNREKIIIDKP